MIKHWTEQKKDYEKALGSLDLITKQAIVNYKDWILFLPTFTTLPEKVKNAIEHMLHNAQHIKAHVRRLRKKKAEDVSELKIHNKDTPACSLSFFWEHKYVFEECPNEAAKKRITGNLDPDLKQASLADIEFSNSQYVQKDQELKEMYDNIDAYEFVESNYDRKYRYLQVAYKYRDGTKFKSKKSQISGKYINLVFVDQELAKEDLTVETIKRHGTRQDKVIEKTLMQYKLIIEGGRLDLYARKKD